MTTDGWNNQSGLPAQRCRLCMGFFVVFTFSLSHFPTFAPVSFAQEATPDSAAPAPGAQDPLAARQQIVRDRLVQLEDRMYRLTEKLSQTEPDQARRLEKALRQSGELLIRRHMDEAVQALDRSDLAAAAEHQAAAEKALEQILTLLTEVADESLDRQRELDRIRELREQVDRLLENQVQLRARTDASEQLAQRLAAAVARIQDLIERQQTQIEQNQPGRPVDGPDQAESQAEIREDTEEVTEELNQPTTRPHGDPLAPVAEEARRGLQDAADAMRAAEEELNAGRSESAAPSQKRALDALQKALESVKQASESAQPLEAAEAARQQQALEKEAGKLADSMEEQQEGEPQADSQPADTQPSESQPGDESPQSSGPQTPGADNVRRAGQHMKKAGQNLDANQPSQATRDQDRAIEELEQAQAELQETLDQLRREQQEEMLAGLEQRFRTMLITQKAINSATVEMEARKENWTRADELNLAGLSEKQSGLSGEAAQALNILVEEGTTVVFPEMVAQVRDDMAAVAGRLGEKQTGEITRGIQGQIVETLEELIDAIEQRQEDGPPPPDGNQAGPGGEAGETPLLPGSAELKLLRSCQVRVNRQTRALAATAEKAPAEIGDEAQRLSDRQEQLSEMARKIDERAERQ